MDGTPQTPLAALELRVLFVGSKEEDFYIVRDVLRQRISTIVAELDQAFSLEEARENIAKTAYDVVLFDSELCKYDDACFEMLRRQLRNVPFVLLEDGEADEAAIAQILQTGAADWIAKSELDGRRLSRSIRGALAIWGASRRQEEAEERLRKLSCAVEQSADMVIVTDTAGRIEYVNPAFEQVTGYSRQEVIGRTTNLLKSGEQTRAIYAELWNTIMAGGVYRGTLINRKKNGELYYGEKSVSPVRDADGCITHFISNDRDVTDKVKMETTLRQGQKMDAIGQLAGGIAHDFNNLLTVIGSYAELMLDTIGADNPLHRNIQEILKAKNRAADLTRQLLAFSRKQMQTLQVVDLNRVLGEICNMLPRLIGEDIEVVFNSAEGLAKVKADPVQVEQIVMNLATNARDAMPNGGRLTIEAANIDLDESYLCAHPIVAPGSYVQLTVSDTGKGIAADRLPHIFEPFFTTKESGQWTGLGLATVYGIVKQNGGFISVYSEEGMGTTFKIYWPQLRTGALKRTSTSRDLPPRGSEVVLLVEDEKAVRESTAEFLEMCGYRVLQGVDGKNAIEVAQAFAGDIDLLLTDVVMPQMSGSEAAKQLRRLRPSMKVLFVSGYAESRALQNGVSDVKGMFLQKPFMLTELGKKIRATLETTPETARVATACGGQ